MSAAAELDRGTQLAVERTWLAHERTMMAWVRTGTSLISFGFTIYKFFQLEIRDSREHGVIGPREFALIMITIGVVSLTLAAVSHYRTLRKMNADYYALPASTAGIVAWLVGALGVLALLAVIFRG